MEKTRPGKKPYLIVVNGSWEYRVLKANTPNPGKVGGSWFCLVTTPFTGPSGDMGDTYISDVQGTVTFRDPVVTDDLLLRHLGGTVQVAKNPMDAWGFCCVPG